MTDPTVIKASGSMVLTNLRIIEVSRLRQTSAGADQQRQFFQRRVQRHPLAAGEPLMAVEIVPTGLIIRQPGL